MEIYCYGFTGYYYIARTRTHTRAHNRDDGTLLLRLSMSMPFLNGNIITEKVSGTLESESRKRGTLPGRLLLRHLKCH
jgi:hypothetical protein